ncbi:MAG: hypothetical protein FWG73_04675 [Planctomycetaceae bacterium]|nr:hypothetical protein [Planctomycetaceae bacterium]
MDDKKIIMESKGFVIPFHSASEQIDSTAFRGITQFTTHMATQKAELIDKKLPAAISRLNGSVFFAV